MPEHAADGVALADDDVEVVVVEVVVFDVVVVVEDDEDDEDVELGVGVIEDEAAGRHCESAVQMQTFRSVFPDPGRSLRSICANSQ